LIADCPQPDGSDGAVLSGEMRAVLDHSPGLLFHDDLAKTNAPVYFHQFASHARRHRLQFLAEANFHEMQLAAYPPEIARQLWRLADHSLIQKEQYLDFLRNRRFRQTLLCREEVALDRTPRRDVIRSLYLGSQARAVAEHPDLDAPGVVEEFRSRGEAAMSTDHPAAKAAMFHLGQAWPRLVGFDDLLRRIGRGGASAGEVTALSEILLAAYAAGLIELHTRAPHFVLEPGPRPTVSPVARLQLERSPFVASLRHTSVYIEDELGRRLLRLMDGTRTIDALRAAIGAFGAGEPAAIEATAVEKKIAEVARLGLFTA
jgi:hypothetical protein